MENIENNVQAQAFEIASLDLNCVHIVELLIITAIAN
jgi:hypothetical protein